MKRISLIFILACLAGCMLVVEPVSAQKDSVYRKTGGKGNSLVRGKVLSTSAFKVTVETKDGNKDVPASEVKKVVFSGEPRAVGRARDQFDDQRYDDCMATLNKMDSVPDAKFVKQEVQFLKSYASAKIALRGDKTITTQAAEQLVANFCKSKSNSDSYRLVPSIDIYAQLLMANGKTASAQKEFSKLTKSKWLDYEVRGYFLKVKH